MGWTITITHGAHGDAAFVFALVITHGDAVVVLALITHGAYSAHGVGVAALVLVLALVLALVHPVSYNPAPYLCSIINNCSYFILLYPLSLLSHNSLLSPLITSLS